MGRPVVLENNELHGTKAIRGLTFTGTKKTIQYLSEKTLPSLSASLGSNDFLLAITQSNKSDFKLLRDQYLIYIRTTTLQNCVPQKLSKLVAPVES